MKKHICILIVFAMLLGLSSCGMGNANRNKVRTVSKDDVWWNDTETVITPDEIKQELNGSFYQLLGNFLAADEDSVILIFMLWNEESSDALLRHYSYDGELLGQVRLSDYFGEGVDFYAPETIYKMNDKYYAVIQHYSKDADSIVNECFEIDFDRSTLNNPFALELPDDGSMFSQIITMTGVGDKLVYLMSTGDYYKHSYKICVVEGDKTRFYVPDFGKDVKTDFIGNFIKYGNGVSFTADTTDNGVAKSYFCTLDLDSFTMQKAEKNDRFFRGSYISDCGVFDCEEYKVISRIDPQTGESTKLADLADSYIQGQFDDMRVVWATDNMIVLYVDDQAPTGGMSTAHLIKLEKADTNPNSGKKILTLGHVEWINLFEYGAINAFNRNSDKYFIEVTDKYYDVARSVYDTPEYQSDPTLIYVSEVNAVDLLMADIRKAEGPDLVLYGSDCAQLNNPDYLIDLTKRINSEKSLTNGDYINAVTSPNGRDGRHYRLDYGCNYTALLIKNSFISDGTAGVTFEQYDKIISERNAGTSILYNDDLSLMKLFMENSDSVSFTKDEKLMLGNDNFRTASEYIASIPDVMTYDDVYWTPMKNMQILEGITFNSFVYLYGKSYKNYSIIGIPSANGQAEVIRGRGVGITNCCALQDAAWEFAMSLMGPDYQNQVNVYYDPVLKSAQKVSFDRYIDYKNAGLNPYNAADTPGSKGIIDYYIGQVSDAVTVPDMDSGIIVIMNEEMPAYYSGQKSLDEVIEVINNRVNLMFAEQR